MGPKYVAFYFGDFDFMTTNHVANIYEKKKATEEYHL